MLRSVLTFGFFTAISRALGLIRDILIAVTLGATSIADVFFSSFRFANLFRAFFAEGAFTSCFIPLYSSEPDENKKEFASSIISISIVILIIFTFIVNIFFPHLVRIFTPGFDQNKLILTVTLSRIMLPYIIFISIASLIGGMLQTKEHFVSTAISPVVLNIALIISLFVPYITTPAHNLAIAVLIGGALQLLLISVSAHKLDISLSFILHFNSRVKMFFKRVIPAIINNCTIQISVWIDMIMASFLPNAVSYIYYAERLVQLPQGVIGVAISTVLLPLISKKTDSITKIQEKALNIGLMLILPITAAFIIIPDFVLLTLFAYGTFDYHAVQQTAHTLIALSLSLPAFIINKVLVPIFFVKGDFRVPTILSLISLTINVTLNLLLMNKYQHVGIAISTSVSTWVNTIMLINHFKRNKVYRVNQFILVNGIRTLTATIVMSIFLYASRFLLVELFFDKLLTRILCLFILVAFSIIIYFGTLYLISIKNSGHLKHL